MIAKMARRWWVFLVRGLCEIVVALVAFTQPLLTLVALIVLWAALVLADGIMTLWAGWTDRREGKGVVMPLIVSGVISILAGATAWMWPGITIFALLAIIAAAAIVRGLFEIYAAILLRKVLEHEWLLAATGALSLLFGIVVLSRPAVGIAALAYVIGAYALASGILLVWLSLKLKGLRNRLESI